jgi:hypothetical protein
MDEPFRIHAKSSNMEATVTNLVKAGVLAAATLAVLLPSLAANAKGGSASVRQACRAQASAIWPNVNSEERRTYNDLVRACVQNGGRIPG